MTTVDSSATAVPGGHQVAAARTAAGRLWVVTQNNTATAYEFHYSDDDGTSFTTSAESVSFSGTVGPPGFCIDLDGHAHLLWRNQESSVGVYRYARNASIGAATTWASGPGAVTSTGANGTQPSIRAFREGSGWRVWGVFATGSGSTAIQGVSLGISSTGTITILSGSGNTFTHSVGTATSLVSVDFHHTGDGLTIKGGAPHLFIGYLAGSGGSESHYLHKASHSAGSWTLGTARNLGEATSYAAALFDGTRVVAACRGRTDTAAVIVRERDAADTTTTVLGSQPAALSGGNIDALALTTRSGDIHLVVSGATAADVEHTRYLRPTATWTAWSTLATTTVAAGHMSTAGATDDRWLDVVWRSSANAEHHGLRLNVPPTAPSWVTASGTFDVDETLTLDWTFEDADAVYGDAQTAYALSRQIGAGSVEYWNTSTWVGTEAKNSTATTSVTLAAAWGDEADANHVYKVKTWDGDDEEGTYGAALTVTPSEQINPTITAPTAAQVLDSAMVTITHTVSEQSAQRHRLLDDVGAVLQTTGWVTNTSAQSTVFSGLENSTDYTAEVTTRNTEGLASDVIEQDFSTDFTEPATPTAPTPTVDNTNHTLTYVVTNPTPAGAEPDVLHNEVWLTTTSGTDAYLPASTTTRVADDVAENGTYVFRTPASDVDYRAFIVAIGDNGTTSTSAAID